MTTTIGQALLDMVESDLVTVGGQPLVTFIEALQAAKGNLALEAAALVQLEAAAPAAGIQFELEVQQQILALALAKLQSYITSKAPAVKPAS